MTYLTLLVIPAAGTALYGFAYAMTRATEDAHRYRLRLLLSAAESEFAASVQRYVAAFNDFGRAITEHLAPAIIDMHAAMRNFAASFNSPTDKEAPQ